MSSPIAVAALATAGGLAAIVDLRTRRVPNILTGALAVTGVALAGSGVSGVTLASSLGGVALGLLIMLPGHLLGGTGAGDVKLFAAAGGIVGAERVLWAFLYMALAGGVMAIIVAIRRRRVKHTLTATTALVVGAGKADIEHPRADNRFAYAPAVAIGTLLAALGI